MTTLTEAPTSISKPSANLFGRVAVSAYFFANGALLASWVTRIPALQHKLHLATGPLGLALLGLAAGALVGMPLAGNLSSRLGSRTVTVFSLLFMCAAIPLVAVASNVWMLAAALCLVGFGNGATDVSMNTQAVAVERTYGRSIMSSFHALWSVGGMAGAAAGSLCIRLGLSPLSHLAGAALLFAVAAAAVSPWLVPAREEQARPVESDASDKPQDRPLPLAPLAALGAVAFCALLSEGAMADWGAIYLHRSLHTTQQLAAGGYAAFSFAMAGGRFAGDSVAHRFGTVALVRSGGLLAAIGLGTALLAGTVAAAFFGLACVGLGISIAVPLVFSAAGNLPGTRAGAAIAAVSTIGYLGFLAGPPLIGFGAEAITLREALAFVVLTNVVIAVLAGNVAGKNPST